MTSRRRRSNKAKPAPEKEKEKEKEQKTEDKPKGLRLQFLDALDAINPGIDEGSIIDQASLVLMDKDKLISYNDEVAVSHPFPIKHQGGVAAKQLYRLIKKLKNDDLEISIGDGKEGQELQIKCGDLKAGFNLVPEISIPDLGINEIDNWTELPADFCHAVEFCISSAATDQIKGVMICIHVEGNIMVACDNLQATCITMKGELPEDMKLNIPRIAAKELGKYMPREVGTDGNWIHFKNDFGTVFSTRTMPDEYPDVLAFWENVDGTKVVLPKEIKDVLGRVEVMAHADEKTGKNVVNIAVLDGMIECSGSCDAGWATEPTPAPFSDDIPKFIISPDLLSRILSLTQDAVITDRIIYFEGDEWKHLACLIQEK